MVEELKEVIEGNKILDELEKGPWPSHVKEVRKTRYPVKLYGASLYAKRDFWTTGGYVSVPGVPTGILMRVTSRPDIGESANVVRVYVPSGQFLSSKMLNKLADFADKYGVGMVHAITTSGDMELPGIPKDRIKEFANEFRADSGMDIGSTGDSFRNTTCCVGPALCEFANIDSLKLRDDFYDAFFDYAKYPTFPHKMKMKISACPLECARATQKGDIAVVGSWVGGPEVDPASMYSLTTRQRQDLVDSCPTGALRLEDGDIDVKGEDCIQCMQCVRLSQGALAPGGKKVYQLFVGGKLRGKKGPFTAKLLAVVETEEQLFDLIRKLVDVFTEQAARKERLGDLIMRVGMKNFLGLMGLPAEPAQVSELRTNIFYGVSAEGRKKAVDMLKARLEGDSE